ncbi:hypothetical protein MRX96_042355 [Rhipicephalus microplus]
MIQFKTGHVMSTPRSGSRLHGCCGQQGADRSTRLAREGCVTRWGTTAAETNASVVHCISMRRPAIGRTCGLPRGAPAKSTLEQKKKKGRKTLRVCLVEGRVYKGAICTLPTCQAPVPRSYGFFRYASPQTRWPGVKRSAGQPERGDATGKIPRERAKAPLTHIAENRNRRQNAEVHDLHMMSAEAPPPPPHVCARRCFLLTSGELGNGAGHSNRGTRCAELIALTDSEATT